MNLVLLLEINCFCVFGLWTVSPVLDVFMLVEKKKETITESAGRQQKKKIGKNPVNKLTQ